MAAQPLNEFELARKKLAQQSALQRQQSEQNLKREFARTGGIGSGAYVKQLQIARENIGQQEQAGQEGITAAQLREQQRQNEIKQGQEFQAGQAKLGREAAIAEAEKGRAFTGQQSELGRALAQKQFEQQQSFAEKQLGQQQSFAGEQAKLGREFATEQLGSQQAFAGGEAEKGRAFQQRLADMDQTFKNQQLDFQKQVQSFNEQSALKQFELAQKQYQLQLDESVFNRNLAEWEKNRPTDIVSSLLGGKFGFGGGGLFGATGNFYSSIGNTIGGALGSIF